MNITYKSKAVRLAEEVLKDIWQKVYPVEEYLPSEDELADKYGSSRMTIRKVLSILERDQVLIKIPNCGSRINPALKLPEPAIVRLPAEPITIGAVMAAFPDAMTIEVNRGIQDFAQKNNLSFLLLQNPEGPEALSRDLAQIDALQLSGLILLTGHNSCDNIIRDLVNRKFPMVCADVSLPNLNLPWVGVDNFGGAYAATVSLLEGFCNGVHYLGETPKCSTQVRRYDGFCQAMTDYGLRTKIPNFTSFYQLPESIGWFDDKHDKFIGKTTMKILTGANPVAIFAENDYIAQIAMDTANNMKRTVGKDVFICGFDDLPLAKTLNLSSIRQPRYEIGYEAAKLLHCLINGNPAITLNKTLPVRLIRRQSGDVSSLVPQNDINDKLQSIGS